ncbi:MAG: amidohydrolase [Nocardioides sp.]|uniref:amidohydrolase n=1 Tax=Nocardioides sp. TaxID=35761 RepID=UPI003D6AB81B
MTLSLSADRRSWARDAYLHLHAHPELSMQEKETAAYVEGRLDELGIESFRCGGTGVVGVLRNGDGPTVAFRADTDGLPVAEETGLPYASTATGTLPDGRIVPVMHACGHDMHTAASLAAAAALVADRTAWAGTLVLIFQPGEETAAGARAMVEDGLWDRAPRPEVVLGQHVFPYPVGTVQVPSTTAMAMADSVRITLRGKQSHGSQPQHSIDPVLLGAHVVTRLQGIVSREVDPRRPTVVTIGTFHAGLKENIIPETAELTLNVRTMDPDTRETVLAAIRRIVVAESQASGASDPEIEEFNSFPQCVNHPETSARVHAALADVFGEDNVSDPEPMMGSEDVGLLWDTLGIPGAYWFVGVATRDDPAPAMNHSPRFAPLLAEGLDASIAAALAALGAWLCPVQ